ncbi:MAG: shikimate dehydrogenase [Ktedonobacteraceae bacterium]
MSIMHEKHPVETVDTLSLLRVGLIGNPVVHSYSPRFQQAAFDALGIPAHYELWQTAATELPTRVASLLAPQYLGANITIPYKQAVLPFLDVVDPLAARIGAVNTIVQRDEYLYGYNTDAPGLLQALAEHGIGTQFENVNLTSTKGSTTFHAGNSSVSLKGYTAVLLGAGGAARSAAFALVHAALDRLIIVNRNLERAQKLAADVQQNSSCQVFSLNNSDFLIPHSPSLIINATAIGMHSADSSKNTEDMTPLPTKVLTRFAADTFIFDMVYNPTQTKLLCQARALGLRTGNGLSMLLHQGALAFTLWTGQPAPLEVMRAALM